MKKRIASMMILASMVASVGFAFAKKPEVQIEESANIKKADVAVTRSSQTVDTYTPNDAIEEKLAIKAYDAEIHPIELTEDDLAQMEYNAELELLACCVEAEAGNQGLVGKQMVAAVILNRVDSPRFPNTITEVITAPHQFTVYGNGMMANTVPSEETYEAVRLELETRAYPDIAYFRTGCYPSSGTPWGVYKAHYFSTF